MNGDDAAPFEQERARLTGLATRILQDHAEAEDVVQQAWLRLRGQGPIDNLAAWLTTVTTRLCLDRLRSRRPVLVGDVADLTVASDDNATSVPDIAEQVALADTVGIALQAVLDRLSPPERVAFVLHDSFGFEFNAIAGILDTSPEAARKLASRARAKVRQPAAEDSLADWEIVDAFMAAAREGNFERLMQLLAPDAAAAEVGTPTHIEGRREVAAFFNGSAQAALAVDVDGRPAAAWFHRGEVRVLFDFSICGGTVTRVTFRADPAVLSRVVRR